MKLCLRLRSSAKLANMPSQLNSAVRVHRQTRLTNTCIFLLGQLATLLDKYTAISLSSIHLTISTQVMTKETTPPPQQSKAPTHEPPSLPASPLAKRTKPDSNNTANSNKMTTGTAPAVTSISQPLPPLLVKKLTESAQAPTRGSAFAAGYDLYSAKETVIPAKGKALVDTGLAIAVPEGTCMPPFSPYFLWSVYANQLTNRRPRCSPEWSCLEALH